MALKDWKKSKYRAWVRKDGVPISNYGFTQLYPFIQIGTIISTKGTKWYRLMRHGTHTSEELFEAKTKKEVEDFAKEYMRRH